MFGRLETAACVAEARGVGVASSVGVLVRVGRNISVGRLVLCMGAWQALNMNTMTAMRIA